MTGALLVAAALLLLAAPRLLVRWTALRRSPLAALCLWQSLTLTTVLCLLTAGPVAMVEILRDGGGTPATRALALVAVVSSGLVLARLVVNGHLVGIRLRAARREHRQLVDLVGRHEDDRTRVLPHDEVGAYCVPGRRSRVVLTDATLERLRPDQLEAVLAHEQAHLRARHDLVLEFFSVLHTAAPSWLRAHTAMHEVRLLVEVLADRYARRRTGPIPLGNALLLLAHAPHPAASLGLGATTTTRIRLLAEDALPLWWTGALYLASGAVLLLPTSLVWLAVGPA